jgi:hypothetical protein
VLALVLAKSLSVEAAARRYGVRLLRDEKASSSLALKPTDLSALLTEQIADLRPL